MWLRLTLQAAQLTSSWCDHSTMGRHIQPCTAASPMLSFTQFPSFLKILFTGKGFVTFHLQMPWPANLSAQWQDSSGMVAALPQAQQHNEETLQGLSHAPRISGSWISKPYQNLSARISVPGRNPLFPQPSWSGMGVQQLPSTLPCVDTVGSTAWAGWEGLVEATGCAVPLRVLGS